MSVYQPCASVTISFTNVFASAVCVCDCISFTSVCVSAMCVCVSHLQVSVYQPCASVSVSHLQMSVRLICLSYLSYIFLSVSVSSGRRSVCLCLSALSDVCSSSISASFSLLCLYVFVQNLSASSVCLFVCLCHSALTVSASMHTDLKAVQQNGEVLQNVMSTC